jgi:hypothetical protein
MSQKRIQQVERRIDRIKRALLEIGPMRPGSLTRQYKDPQHHAGAYWQISYTRRIKSRTEYVRREWVKDLRRQIASHKRFKSLVEQWIDHPAPLVPCCAANLQSGLQISAYRQIPHLSVPGCHAREGTSTRHRDSGEYPWIDRQHLGRAM